MIHEVDSALRTLIERDASGTRDVEIVFDAPTREWAGRRNSPTIDIYLYDIREDLRRRERGMHNVYDESKIIVSRHLPPRHFKLSYLVTAWTQRPEDEHRLLSSLLTCFLRYDALPQEVLTGPLTDLGLPIPITIALPPPEDRAFADVWSALGGELKPSIDLVVTTPLDTGQQFHTGPPVERPPHISLGGALGWPTRETKSRNGVVAWPPGTDGPTAADAAGSAARGSDRAGSTGDRAGSTGDRAEPTGDRAESTAGGRTRRGKGREATSKRGPAEQGEDDTRTGDDGWATATSWADAMPPLGSPEAGAPVAGRAAGHRQPGASLTAGSASAGTSSEPADGTGPAPTTAEAAKTGSSKGGGRPGTRVAITRKRQPKKGP